MKTKFKYFRYVVLLLAITNLSTIFSQTSRTDPNDNQGWYGAKLKVDLPEGWGTSLDYQSRFINDLQMYNGSYISLGVTKRINKIFKIESDYRLALVQKGIYHRVRIGADATKKIGDFDFNLRLLVQNQLQDFDEINKSNQREGYWRARFEVNYGPTDGFDLYASTEPIMKFGGNRIIDNWRNTLGLKIKVAKRTKLDLFYIYRQDYAKATYDRLFQVIGVNIDYTLKIKKTNIGGHYLISK